MDRGKNRGWQVHVPCPPKKNVIPRILVFVVKDVLQAKIAPTRTANSPAVPKLTALLITPPEVLPAELPGVVVGEEEEELDDERTGVVVVVGVGSLVEVGVVVGVEVVVAGETELLAGSEEREEPDGRLAELEPFKQSLVPF